MQYEITDGQLIGMMEVLEGGYTYEMRDRYNYLLDVTEFAKKHSITDAAIALDAYDLIMDATTTGMLKETMQRKTSEVLKEVLDGNTEYEFARSSIFGVCPYLYDTEYRCYRCENIFHESEMIKVDDMVAQDHSIACPHCKAKSLPIGRRHIQTSGFSIIKASDSND